MSTKKTAATTESKGRYVLVTTAHRGVFAGYLVGEPSKEKCMLTDARNCVRWTEAERGFLGLAERGPGKDCRVGPAVPELTLWDITGVATCTAEAEDAWQQGAWR